MRSLPQEYRREPAIALDGGTDGMDIVARILAGAGRYLTSSGNMVVEIGHNRPAFERRYPNLAVTWLNSGNEQDALLWIESRQLRQQAWPK